MKDCEAARRSLGGFQEKLQRVLRLKSVLVYIRLQVARGTGNQLGILVKRGRMGKTCCR